MRHFFRILRPFFAFRISQHFAPGSAFTQKVKGFRGLFFRGINKTRNSYETRKVYCECFVFRGVFRKNTREMRNVKVYSRPKTFIVPFVSFLK